MENPKQLLKDGLFTLATLVTAFLVNLFLVAKFDTKTMTPMIFVLGVFLVSWRTQGYLFGILASLVSVLAVNWAATAPPSAPAPTLPASAFCARKVMRLRTPTSSRSAFPLPWPPSSPLIS